MESWHFIGTMKLLNILWMLGAFFGYVHCSVEVPKEYKKCSIGPEFDKCMVEAMNDALPKIVAGYKELGLPQLEPFLIPHVKLVRSSGAVALDEEYENIAISNLILKTTVEKFSLDLDKKEIQFNIFNERMDATSECKLKGRILILPIEGEGRCAQSYTKVHTEFTMKFEERIHDNEVYWHFTTVSTKLGKPEKLTIHFANLFNGNKELGDKTNNFLNEHWEEVFKDLEPDYSKAFGQIVLGVFNQVFDQIPIAKIFSK